MKSGDNVRYYLTDTTYIAGIVVEMCEDGKVWVEYENGQQMQHTASELILE